MLKKVFNKIKNSLWLTPALYSAIGLCIAILTITLDMYFNEHYEKFVPDIFLTSVDLATEILATLSSALITMTTFTFSMTMVVLTTYSSQFSPRALPNFMTQKATMRVLGIFLGGFIYSINSLLFMRNSLDNEFVISAVIGVFITIICLLFFIYFIHFIAKSIQVDNLIENIAEETLKSSKDIKNKMRDHKLTTVKQYSPPYLYGHSYYAKSSDYIKRVEMEELVSLAATKYIFIKIHHKIGEFITDNTLLFTIYSDEANLEEGVMKECADYITLGRKRSPSQDLAYSLQQLVEIALRATSPAINDPYTAKHCIRNVGKVLAESNTILDGDSLYMDTENQPRLLIPMEDLNNLLYFTFNQFNIEKRKDIIILGAIMDALIMTAQKCSDDNKKILWSFLAYKTFSFDELHQLHPYDQKFLEIKKQKLFEVTH
ncbi:DUF2254 domain-containing protein [Aquibacillus koreensis]|uniref:DUF2254 domain-containing protein n=2 Tax=Aquibacillus koreensis TaxID=279446 RepID=A0A9X4AIU3_9BACI|nr:DUF2254 domain-containing protein [Aquibacillus koreensis]MCT2536737.1 DUF2254 domain-containing protein [Aquibacillus koreensis]MDC3421507.1 DUF2254 domain-containing protein [Aquibacillus koreensis]